MFLTLFMRHTETDTGMIRLPWTDVMPMKKSRFYEIPGAHRPDVSLPYIILGGISMAELSSRNWNTCSSMKRKKCGWRSVFCRIVRQYMLTLAWFRNLHVLDSPWKEGLFFSCGSAAVHSRASQSLLTATRFSWANVIMTTSGTHYTQMCADMITTKRFAGFTNYSDWLRILAKMNGDSKCHSRPTRIRKFLFHQQILALTATQLAVEN